MKKINKLNLIMLILFTLTFNAIAKTNVSKAIKFDRKMPLKLSALMGSGSSGGGNSIIFKDGRTDLLDLVNPSTVNFNKVATEKERESIFWKNNRYVKHIATSNNSFFNEAIKIFKSNHNEFPVLRKLNEKLSNLHAVLIEFRAEPLKRYFSDSFSSTIQEPLAVYINHELLVSKRPFMAMSELHRTGLSIHEALRHLNFLDVLEENLLTSDIETLVRFFLNKSFDSDDVTAATTKLLAVKEDNRERDIRRLKEIRKRKLELTKQIGLLSNKIKRNDLTDEQIEELMALEEEFISIDNIEDDYILQALEGSTENHIAELKQIRKRKLEIWERRGIIKNIETLTEESKLIVAEAVALEEERIKLDDKEHSYVIKHLDNTVSALERSAFGLNSVISKTLLEIELPVCQRFDVLEIKTVHKCFQ